MTVDPTPHRHWCGKFWLRSWQFYMPVSKRRVNQNHYWIIVIGGTDFLPPRLQFLEIPLALLAGLRCERCCCSACFFILGGVRTAIHHNPTRYLVTGLLAEKQCRVLLEVAAIDAAGDVMIDKLKRPSRDLETSKVFFLFQQTST